MVSGFVLPSRPCTVLLILYTDIILIQYLKPFCAHFQLVFPTSSNSNYTLWLRFIFIRVSEYSEHPSRRAAPTPEQELTFPIDWFYFKRFRAHSMDVSHCLWWILVLSRELDWKQKQIGRAEVVSFVWCVLCVCRMVIGDGGEIHVEWIK